jgi:DNA segregation ATPase FtsK/SpoIIIE, S-DNA-T family
MTILSPRRPSRLNEVVGFLLFLVGLALALCLASYSPVDSSWDTASNVLHTQNLLGPAGAWAADILFQIFGFSAWLLPLFIWALGWKWVRSSAIRAPYFRLAGAVALWLTVSSACGLVPDWRPIRGGLAASGIAGRLLADYLVAHVNPVGAVIISVAAGLIALYLLTSFEVALLSRLFRAPAASLRNFFAGIGRWREERRERAIQAAGEREAARIKKQLAKEKQREQDAVESARPRRRSMNILIPDADEPEEYARVVGPDSIEPRKSRQRRVPANGEPAIEDIPIRPFEPASEAAAVGTDLVTAVSEQSPDGPEDDEPPFEIPRPAQPAAPSVRRKRVYRLPSTTLLNEVPPRGGFDGQELKEIATRIKSKLEEFNVRGSVVQINPGPVVTTFEYKPEAGMKYSRITTLSEDLCLGLQAESILIERLPGKPTVGIEVPNTRREVISLREILESADFTGAASKLTITLGKDINGRIKVAPLEAMPHLLIAGSTGSGKSVMLNAMIMSFLYKATPDEVKMIMVDPKRVELGIYEGIPHLLTPVITEPKKATNALRNAVFEMERRLKLLASQGVRNIDQFNKKVAQKQREPRSLFEDEAEEEELEPLPYILIIIDELADLMMLERANVEECITRLAQMARAVGMHLVLATQRPSVDVITGLIKANFPSRISFRVATRVDSRTVLDWTGAEHLLGRGDMLFLPPGSSRLTRVHGALVTEAETNRVVEFWREQASPEYDQSFLLAPPTEDDQDGEADLGEGGEDPLYQDAVRVVVDMGKASTSTLQRRLRLGYGRAARILDMMQRDGVIGPPDGSRPREVLKRPEWLDEVRN